MAPAIAGADPVPAKNTTSFVASNQGQKEVSPLKFDLDPKMMGQPFVAAQADPVQLQPGSGNKAVVYFAAGTKFKGNAAWNTDGDGVRVNTPDGKSQIECRIDMIDAPETPKRGIPGKSVDKPGQPYGQEAKTALASMLSNKALNVTVVQGPSKQNYDRHICRIEVEGKDVSLEMVKAGHAFLYDEFAAPAIFKQAELNARNKDLGLWKGPGEPERPYPYRKRYGILDKQEQLNNKR